ncbi:MAG: hypothetical protein HY909_18185 [Deltaproteobacteria bacterium]|nr:hypothetical protein [Deltaproteobacteria bacterium]
MNKWLICGALAAGCGVGPGQAPGTLRVVLEAEETITQGIPARVGTSGEGVQDGWALTYTRFWVVLGRVELSSAAGARVVVPTAWATGSRVVDLRAGTQDAFTVQGVAPARYDRVSYESRPADASTEYPAGASMADRQAMLGSSTWIEVTATRGARSVRLSWRFSEGWRYSDCEGPETRPGRGFVAASGGATVLALSIHGDHWWWQTLGQEGSPVRFDPIANADTAMAPYAGNGDGEVTLEECERVGLAQIPPADGVFNPLGRATTLGGFLRESTGTNGHIDGDGVCAAARVR